jgi:hypothetical protein
MAPSREAGVRSGRRRCPATTLSSGDEKAINYVRKRKKNTLTCAPWIAESTAMRTAAFHETSRELRCLNRGEFSVSNIFRVVGLPELSLYPSANRPSHFLRCLACYTIDCHHFRQVSQQTGDIKVRRDDESGESDGGPQPNPPEEHRPRVCAPRSPHC